MKPRSNLPETSLPRHPQPWRAVCVLLTGSLTVLTGLATGNAADVILVRAVVSAIAVTAVLQLTRGIVGYLLSKDRSP